MYEGDKKKVGRIFCHQERKKNRFKEPKSWQNFLEKFIVQKVEFTLNLFFYIVIR